MESNASAPGTLHTAPASAGHRRLALGVTLVSLVLFAALAPFAGRQLDRLPAFIPLYQAALVVIDLVTAALLFAQTRVERTRPLFILACGYLFTALMISAHTLSFPGLFAARGVIGGGEQTTAWLYMFWHAGFPVVVALYARAAPAPLSGRAAALGIVATAAAAAALTALATAGEGLLPGIMAGNQYRPAYHFVVGAVWLCSFGALALVWTRRQRSVLDIWIMVVLCVWLCEVALAAVLNQGRFDLGFYAGRIYGLAAAAFLLGVLVWETSGLHARAAAADAQRVAATEAAAENRAKDRFLAVLGHELRNPLAPIVAALEVMRLRDPSALSGERVIIERQVQHLRRLVDDLLDSSRFARGLMNLRRVRCDAAELVARAVEMARPAIAAKSHRLEVDAPPGLRLEADPDRVEQALCNLLVNAAKFTPPGGRIRISVDEEDGYAVFRVSDNGEGIREELMARLFQPFVQAPQTFERSQGGLGLGLAIVRSIVGLHGGEVRAVSAGPGKGTEVTLRLPAAGAGTTATAGGKDAADVWLAPPGVRVLVVDDNEDAAEMVAMVLRGSRLEVATAHSPEDALARAREFKPAIALLDLGLPRMDGVELAEELRRLPGLADLRIAALTGYGEDSDRARTTRAGFRGHFVKPADVLELIAFMRATVETRAAEPGRQGEVRGGTSARM